MTNTSIRIDRSHWACIKRDDISHCAPRRVDRCIAYAGILSRIPVWDTYRIIWPPSVRYQVWIQCTALHSTSAASWYRRTPSPRVRSLA
eukprot:5442077-Pleurochrysis_carterae.AAC.3